MVQSQIQYVIPTTIKIRFWIYFPNKYKKLHISRKNSFFGHYRNFGLPNNLKKRTTQSNHLTYIANSSQPNLSIRIRAYLNRSRNCLFTSTSALDNKYPDVSTDATHVLAPRRLVLKLGTKRFIFCLLALLRLLLPLSYTRVRTHLSL